MDKKQLQKALRKTRHISDKYARMNALNDILNGYGVECIRRDTWTSPPICEYINMGDTYTLTVIQPIIYEDEYGYRTKFGRIRIQSMGDFAEQYDCKHNKNKEMEQ